MKKAQATLEFCLSLILALALISGFVFIAKYLRDRLLPRQDQYEFDRLGAGSKASPGIPFIGYTPSLIGRDQVYYLEEKRR